MRYLNWDVLLFPSGSKVPMQEFKTGCYAVQDGELFGAEGMIAGSLAFDHVSPPQVPVVTCFLANQLDGSPFRVSLHSWERPVPTQQLKAVVMQGRSVCFEARVFIDGQCVAGILFLDQGPWPQVIEMSSQVDNKGNRDALRWPKFHQEVLTQNYWSAGEAMGRIKVTITEGYLQAPGALPFIRVKNLVTFSFQHVPQHILEQSGIAWPNAGMWYQPSRPMYHPASPTKQEISSEETDMHAHSPRRRLDSMASLEEKMANKMSFPYGTMEPIQRPQGFQSVAQMPDWTMADPFVESGRRSMINRYGVRSSESDQPMPDYSQSITPASSRNATNEVSMRSLSNSSHQDILDDLIPIFSRNNGTGTNAPANTRVNSVTNTPIVPTRPSAAAEARAASYPSAQERARAVSIPTKDASAKTREPSDASMQFRFSDDSTDSSKIQIKPAMEIKGRKEGKGSELDTQHLQVDKRHSRTSTGGLGSSDKENEKVIASATVKVALSDGKRKRVCTGLAQDVHRAKEVEVGGSSPSVRRRTTERLLVGDSGSEEDEGVDLGKNGRIVLGVLGERDVSSNGMGSVS